jgi:O-antigen ligase
MNLSKFFRKALFILGLVSIPWGYRHLFSQLTPGFHEYEALFFYAHDILIIAFILFFGGLFFSAGVRRFIRARPFLFGALGVFMAFALLSGFFAGYPLLATYAFLRLLVAVLFGVTLGFALESRTVSFRFIWGVLLALATGEALIAITQFIAQQSIGLRLLGEPYLPPLLVTHGVLPQGLATVNLWGGKFLRAYGTFPHPNVLAAFLLMGLAAVFYFWLTNNFVRYTFSPGKWLRDNARAVWIDMGLGICFFFIVLALLFTFSRAAWGLAVLMGAATILYGLVRKETWYQAAKLAVLGGAIACIFVFQFREFLLPRAEISASEPSVTYRVAYNELAVKLIENHPWGIGIGNQVIYSVESGLYVAEGMPLLWQWQPIHNLYLLMAAEIGVLGSLAFIVFIASLIMYHVTRIIRDGADISSFVTCSMLCVLLLFGLIDHFLWTLEPGRLMLWAVIGMCLGKLSE